MDTITLKQSDLVLQGSICLAKDSQTDTKSQKISLLARTSEPFFHAGFGADVINDFSTMTHASKIALDFEHDQIIGYANGFNIDETGLNLSGVLTASNDTSAEVIQFLRDGIPLQASISFRDFECEYVMPGAMCNVNNKTLTAGEYGLYVIKNWNLYACAVCKQGYDGRTATNIELTFNVKKDIKMSEQVAVEEEAKVEAEIEAVETEAVESDATEVQEEVAVEVPAVEEPVKLSVPIDTVKEFVAEFGQDKAVEFVIAGKSIEVARAEHYQALKLEVIELRKQVELLKVEAPRVQFESSDSKPTQVQLVNGLDQSQSMLANRITHK